MSESEQRRVWKAYDSNEDLMTEISFGPAIIRVARPTVAAWSALEAIMNAHNYIIRSEHTHGYFPRNIAETTTRSLHAFGIAIDVNADTNPVRKTPNHRKVWFSKKATQIERAHDVSINAADTDMPIEMIEDVLAVRTLGKNRLFGWGGDWVKKKDAMHFHIDVSPQELARGIDTSTVRGFDETLIAEFEEESGSIAPETDPLSVFDVNDDLWETDSMVDMSQVARFRPFLDFIAGHEGTAHRPGRGYDTSLGYGRFSGGEKTLTLMSLDQIDALQTAMLDHPANNFNSSALGRYQIVRKTLRGLRKELGLSGSELYSAQLQDRLAVALIKRRGRDITGLRNEWASLVSVSAGAILGAYDARGTFSDDVPIPGPVFEQPTDINKLFEMLMQKLSGSSMPQQIPEPVLKPGDRGPAVSALQEALSRRNYQVGTIDGVYGSLTAGAVSAFQLDYKVATDTIGSVDAATWAALRDAPGRPLAEGRLTATADDLRKKGSQIIANADRSNLVAKITSLLGALGLGNFALNEYMGTGAQQPPPRPSPTATTITAPVDQQIAHAMSPFASSEYRSFFGLNTAQTNSAVVKINDLDRLYLRSNPAQQASAPVQTMESTEVPATNPLTGLLSGAANLLLPGAGSSLAILALGVASHLFGTRIINRRVEDQRNGSNIGRLFSGN
ncbi:Peptidoglycan-binding (PGRP) domain of peptidoglycan hydrolases-containing protein [Mesorhizobium albiziae]|uniref:Peptidoglycan-binding (PGRP) domain of peptidoglycan hydrolases-containing protein n=1 Tax=Neomesorhizobium albiziae TaxID=335020 RepID=A0A1I3Y316_9HYPH|nr:peptidoglycan-binding protein [Mesorhizobium albiziae]SFK25691.1 Peptidoglycan-binding (PGRP) domain of peptidoglycan hydrolases-containing protein [Mesorhizobium albiziae]